MDRNRDRFKDALRMGQRPQIEDYLSGADEVELPALLRELLALEIEFRVNQGDVPLPDDYRKRFPGLTKVICSVFDEPVFFRGGTGDEKVSLLSLTVGSTIEGRPQGFGGDPTVSYHPVSPSSGKGRERSPGLPAGLSRLEFSGYRILGKIGRGGMGSVYKAVHLNSNTIVAIKVPHGRPTGDADLERRFDREAKFVEMLAHPCIVRAFDIGRAGGKPFFAMEYVEGESVRERLAREGVFGEEEALGVALSVLGAITYLGAIELVHRDIKPGNIMLADAGTVKLADLGLIHLTSRKDWAFAEAGMLVGTPLYMSPEQARGLDKLDTRSDVYSLGASLYQMVTGRSPCRGQTRAEILQWLLDDSDPPVSPMSVNPAVSPGFSGAIMRMISKRREDRDDPNASRERLTALLRDETRAALILPESHPSGYLRYETDQDDVSEILGSVRKLLIVDDWPDKIYGNFYGHLCKACCPQAEQRVFAPGLLCLRGQAKSSLWDQAAQWAAQHQPDLVLVAPYDIGVLPGTPEEKFYSCMKLNEVTRMIPIIRSAGVEYVNFHFAFDYADAFLNLPVLPEDFRRTLYSILRRSRAT